MSSPRPQRNHRLPTCDTCGQPVYYQTDGTQIDGEGDSFERHECPEPDDSEGEA